MASNYAQLDRCLEAFHVKGAVGAGPPDLVQVICMMAEIEELRADASRLRECLLVMSAAQVGDGSFRTAAHDVATTDVTADRLRERFS